jgi:hypothetical protein
MPAPAGTSPSISLLKSWLRADEGEEPVSKITLKETQVAVT